MSRAITYIDIINWLKTNNKQYILNDDEKSFKIKTKEQNKSGLYAKLSYTCVKCGRVFDRSFNIIKCSQLDFVVCYDCAVGKRNEKQNEASINKIKELCKERQFTIDKIRREPNIWHIDGWCACGNYVKNVDSVSLNNSKRNGTERYFCRQCLKEHLRNTFKWSKEELIQFLANKNCELLSSYSDYDNNHSKLLFRMSCGHEYITNVASIKRSKTLCRECSIIANSGENTYNWKGGIYDTERDEITKTYEYKKFCQDVKERDGYTCQHCGKYGGKIVTHHLDGFNWAIDKRMDADNAVTLCEDCHKEFHSIYGCGNNTKEQFEEFQQNIQINIGLK